MLDGARHVDVVKLSCLRGIYSPAPSKERWGMTGECSFSCSFFELPVCKLYYVSIDHLTEQTGAETLMSIGKSVYFQSGLERAKRR